MFRMKTSYFIILFIFFGVSPGAYASPQCADLFSNERSSRLFSQMAQSSKELLAKVLIRKPKGVLFTEAHVAAWNVLLSDQTQFKKLDYVMGTRDSRNPVVWYVWKKIPENSKEAILDLLSEDFGDEIQIRRGVQKRLELISADPLNNKRFFETILSTWLSDKRVINVTFAEWLAKNLIDYDKKLAESSTFLQEVKEKYRFGAAATSAKKYWSDRAGVQLLLIEENGNHARVNVEGTWFEAKINSSKASLRVLVPRNRVKVAAWNPIYHEVILKKISQGGTPLKEYPGFLGADGYFYLSDGNHRFTIDRRELVWIEMSYPAKSSSLAITFDAMGIPQPKIEDLIQFYQGETDLKDLMPQKTLSEIVFTGPPPPETESDPL